MVIESSRKHFIACLAKNIMSQSFVLTKQNLLLNKIYSYIIVEDLGKICHSPLRFTFKNS